MLLAKGLYFEILILLYLAESIIQPEPCVRYFCMFDIILLYVDLNISSSSLSLIVVSAFELK